MSSASQKVLILNADYRALTICSTHKAFLLVYLEKAEIVTKAAGRMLRTVTRAYDAPSVIRLFKYVNIPYKGVMMTRQNIFRRDNFTCVYCGVKENLTLDHVMPRSRGGKSSWTNLVTACQGCNSKKGDFTPEEIEMNLPYKPFKPTFVMFIKEYSGMGDDTWHPYLKVAN